MEIKTSKELRIELLREIEAAGGKRAWAKKNRVSPSLVLTALNENKPFPPKVAYSLGKTGYKKSPQTWVINKKTRKPAVKADTTKTKT